MVAAPQLKGQQGTSQTNSDLLHPRVEPPSNNSRHDCCWKEVPFSDGLWVEGLEIAKGDFCRLLITFSKSLDPDQDIQNASPDLDPNCLKL